ncbi:sensor histidine kinase [Streptomyces thermolineatus]|uniref:sensor histidine kinase n=1 Tax=Streptomyces thermolineatus TaxID=44033 RepID=UPI00384D5713
MSRLLHLLVAGLLALAAGRALVAGGPDGAAVTAAAVLTGAVYAAGPLLPVTRWGRGPAVWLLVLGGAWLVLLWLAPDGIWLAFPLFFVQLQLLPVRWGTAAVAATTVAAVAGFAWHRGGPSVGTVVGPVLGAAVAVATVLGYQALYRESEERRRVVEELTEAREGLAAADHAAGVMAERERLAREIHDTLAQGLSSIQLLLRAAERALPDGAGDAQEYVRQARQAAQDNLAEARRFVRALTPPGLEGSSLSAALERLCATTAAQHGLPVHFHVSGHPCALPTTHEVALLRIAQSALSNTVRHARATQAEVTLSYMDTQVALDVVDDGTGFDPAAVPPPGGGSDRGGFGLAAMRARTRALGGVLTVESAPGQGTALAAMLPRAAQEPGAQESGAEESGAQESGAEESGAEESGAEEPAVRKPAAAQEPGAGRAGGVRGSGPAADPFVRTADE